MGDKVSGWFYKQQLTLSPKPDYNRSFFEIEKVISKKIVKKQKYLYVKFLYYPKKFNQWVLAENVKQS